MNKMPEKNSAVLITGGSGLIGKYLTSTLLGEGYDVAHLSRSANQFGRVRVFRWNPEKGVLDPVVFNGVGTIISLAGANIGDGRWTSGRKKTILNSRTAGIRLLHRTIVENSIDIKAFVSASAIGYYGSVNSERIFTEEDEPGAGFLAETCRLWEEAADLFTGSGIRTVKIRTGVVLEKNDSALRKLMIPAKFGLIVRTGSGHQYMPWIHILDICGIYLKAVKDLNMSGVYNAVSPQHTTHDEFMKALASVMGLPVILPPVPSFLVRAMLGEMADVILKGSRVSSQKIIKAGYHFSFDNLHDALSDILSSQQT
jgi:uncharacterized protein (TIGR01777 family)